MEDLSFLMKLSMNMRCSLECGEPLRTFLYRFLSQEHSLSAIKFKQWFLHYERTHINQSKLFKSNIYHIFLDLLEQGLAGVGILERFKVFEEELIEVCKEQLQKKLDRLPYEMMLPILLFMFPGYLLLILGPLVVHLLESM